MGEWPKDKLLRHGLELAMEERIRRYQHKIRTIRAAGCAVPNVIRAGQFEAGT